jgi:hypothetical protein
VTQPGHDPPGLDHLVGVGGPEDEEPWHGAQRGELLDGLVGRAVSPTPIESCVKMWMTGISISAERRIAPRA